MSVPGPTDHRTRRKATGRSRTSTKPAPSARTASSAAAETDNRAAHGTEAPRPLYTAGGIAAATSVAIGLAVLTTLTLIGWVAAPNASFGVDIPELFRIVVQAWLVGHLAGFAVSGGDITLLPLGLVILPGLLLYRSGRWLARSCDLPRVRHVFQAALAIAGPYAAIAGTLALTAHTELVRPSMPQALVAGFAVAYIAGGLGVLRQLLIDKDIARRRLLRLMPPRARSLLLGTTNAVTLLLVAGLVLFLSGLIANFGAAASVTAELRPGIVGGLLLLVLQLLYLPNAVIFGMSYAAGPGFAVGAETMIAPTGVSYDPLPQLPMLAALPDQGPAPVLSLVALSAPFLAGALGGWRTLRTAPTPVSEAAPLWGLACGVLTGAVCGLLALLAGGSLGVERLAVVGSTFWQVGLAVAIQVGAVAAVTGWLANWLAYRRLAARGEEPQPAVTTDPEPEVAVADDPLPEEPSRSRFLRPRAKRLGLGALRLWPRRFRRRGATSAVSANAGDTMDARDTADTADASDTTDAAASVPEEGDDADGAELFGISYEADLGHQEPPTAPAAEQDTVGGASVTYLAARRRERDTS